MGSEDFLVRLTTTLSPEAVEGRLVRIMGVSLDPTHQDLQRERHLRLEDHEHIIEMEMSATPSGTTLSVRFSLCHPDSIDEVFASFVLELATQFRAHVDVAEDVTSDGADQGWTFPAASGEELRRCLVESIPTKRRLWHSDFGEERARLSCHQALERFVIERGRRG